LSTSAPKIGLLWRDNASAENERARLQPIFEALSGLHVDAVPVLYSEAVEDAVREELLHLDGVLVWVDPLAFGQTRARLDVLLREAVADGVWVSADPDVILLMGTKEVLFSTRHLGWGTDTDEYGTVGEFYDRFPRRLVTTGPRVLKQYRGNGGQGVWKIELLSSAPDQIGFGSGQALGPATVVRVLEGRRGSLEEDLSLREFMDRCTSYFDGFGRIIDQPFQVRLPEGMIRCYLMQDRVIGFAHQLIRGLMPAPAGSDAASLPQPGPRIMQPPDAPGFERLLRRMEDWVPELCKTLDIDRASLPVLWDADFLLGPKDAAGEDTYVLCEINVSCITPYPEFAAAAIARTTVYRALMARQARERG
jgi:hypothetical protein